MKQSKCTHRVAWEGVVGLWPSRQVCLRLNELQESNNRHWDQMEAHRVVVCDGLATRTIVVVRDVKHLAS